MKRIHLYYFLLMAATMLLTACQESSDLRKLKQYTANIRQRVSNDIKKQNMTDFHLPTPVIYQSDTFSSDSNNASQNSTVIVDPLVAYPLKSYQFTGTITEGNQQWAFLLGPDNNIHQVKEGDVIGDSYDKISKIFMDHIEVIQKHFDSKKQPANKIVILQLKD